MRRNVADGTFHVEHSRSQPSEQPAPIHARVMIHRSCGCEEMAEQICTECVRYLEETACDTHRDDLLPPNACAAGCFSAKFAPE